MKNEFQRIEAPICISRFIHSMATRHVVVIWVLPQFWRRFGGFTAAFLRPHPKQRNRSGTEGKHQLSRQKPRAYHTHVLAGLSVHLTICYTSATCRQRSGRATRLTYAFQQSYST